MLTIFVHTTQHIGTDVGWAASLIFQQVILAHKVFAETEVGDGDSATSFVQNHVSQFEISVDYIFLK